MSMMTKQRNGRQRARTQTPRQSRNGTGNAKQNYERYLVLAREAQRAGDAVEMERCFQYAEHYFRVLRSPDDT